MTVDDFGIVSDEMTRRNAFAVVCHGDELHAIRLGDLFWTNVKSSKASRAVLLVHEISHFVDVGRTFDFEYEQERCLALASIKPVKALYNAANFGNFIKA